MYWYSSAALAAKTSGVKGFIDRMVASGCSRDWFFDPVVSVWDARAKCKEDQVKAHATHLFFYLGNPMEPGNPLSAYSMVEATMAAYDTGCCVAVFDTNSLRGHARDAVAKAMQDLRRRFPGAPIFDNLSAAEQWLLGQLPRR